MIPQSGSRLVMASDGLWDHMSGAKACTYSRSLKLKQVPKRLMNLASSTAGRLSDDTTILVTDILPVGIPDFSSTGQSVGRFVVRGLKNLARRTVQRGWRMLSGARKRCTYYADIDGLLEYPEVFLKEATSLSASPSSLLSKRAGHSWGSVDTSKSSIDGWDLYTVSWDYAAIQRDLCVSSRLNDDFQKAAQNIMDSAQIYGDDGGSIVHQQGVPSVPYKLKVSIQECEVPSDGVEDFLHMFR